MKQGYAIKQVKDICAKGSSQVAQKDLEGLAGDYPIYGASGLIKNVDFYHQEKEYIGLVKDGSGIGRVMFLPPQSSVIGTLQYILPKDGFNIRYIGYCLQSLRLDKYKQGAAIPHIYFKDYGEAKILVATNLDEQQRIVALLDAEFAKIDALKANAEKNLQNAKDLFQAALKKELEPKEGWKKDFLSKIAYISRGRSQHRPRNEASLYGGDYPFIQTGDIRDANGGTISTFNQTYSEIGLQQSKLWKKGTICITIAANIGETAILGMDACFPDSVVGIIPNNQIVCTDFLNYCLTKEKDELNEIAHGTAQKNINVAILEKVLITYPIEISIQQSIVARLDALNEKCKTLQSNYEKTLSLCDDLKQALLREAFNGEI